MPFDFSESLAGTMAPPVLKKGLVQGSSLIFQMSLLPEEIIPEDYMNALSSANPKGSYLSLFRFRELANSVPAFIRYYNPSGSFIETLVYNFLFGATIKPNNNFTQMAFTNGQETFSNSRIGAMDGLPASWRPVYANPWNWASLLATKTGLLDMTMDMTKSTSFGPQTYTVIGQGQNELIWTIGTGANGKTFGPNTKIRFVRFKYMKVDMQRPWLDFELFSMNGWYLSGQEKGFYSSGKTDQNYGAMPMVPVSVIIATDLEIYGQVDASDQRYISDMLAQQQVVKLGYLPFSKTSFGQGNSESVLKSEGFFTMAWLNRLLPLAPAVGDVVG